MREHGSRAALIAALVSLGLAPAVAAAAPPPAKLKSVSAPPASAEAGERFTLKGKVRNGARRAHRARMTVSLRSTRRSRSGRVAASRYLRVKGRTTRRYALRVRVPASIAAGRYHVAVCARVGARRSCRFTRTRLRVVARPAATPPGRGLPPAAGGGVQPSPPAPGPVVRDGRTQPAYGYADAVRQRVWVGIEHDTDGDGTEDRIAVDIIRPRASEGGGLKVPVIMDASPYYDTVCRGNEAQCKADLDGDGINDSWPLFYDNYFVPRGYAVAYLDTVGTAQSTGCPTVGGEEDIHGITRVIDWLNGRATGYDAQSGGQRVDSGWSTGKVGMIGKSYDGTHANGAAATGVEGLETIVPISAISSWYRYYRVNGLRFGLGGPSGLSNAVTFPARREDCGPARQRLATNAGEGAGIPESRAGDYNAFWAERDYEKDADRVNASVFLVHGLNDYNVKPSNYDEWWGNLAAHDVPRKLWLTQTGHVDPFDFDRAEWVDTLHGWFDHWLHDVDNGIMDEPMARIEQQPNLTGRTPAYREHATYPDAGARPTDVWLRTPEEEDEPGSLSTDRGDGGPTQAFVDRRDQTEAQAIAEPDAVANPNRLAYLSPELARGVRISGRSALTVRIAADQADAALGAMLVDYAGEPFERIDYRNRDGVRTLSEAARECYGEASLQDNGCYLPVERTYTTTTSALVARGAIDVGNRDSLWSKTALPVDQEVWVQVPLWGNDYTFSAGHRIGVVLVGTYGSYPSRAKTTPEPTFTLDVTASKLTLPVVGGRDALGF